MFLLFFSTAVLITAQKPCGYKDGLQEGACKEFYDNGQVKNTVEWKKGKLDGDAVFYYDNGKVQSKGEYKKGYNGRILIKMESSLPKKFSEMERRIFMITALPLLFILLQVK